MLQGKHKKLAPFRVLLLFLFLFLIQYNCCIMEMSVGGNFVMLHFLAVYHL